MAKPSYNILQQIFLIAFIYITSYQVIVLVGGGHGTLLHRKLKRTEAQLTQHYKDLQLHQRDLLILSEQIRSDPSYITIEARGLGYYEVSDQLILINTWQQAQPAPSPGTQFKVDVESADASSRPLFLYSLILSAVLWLLVRLLHFGRNDILPKHFRPEGRKLSFHHSRTAKFGNVKNTELLTPGGPYMPERPDQQDSFGNFRS